MSDLTAQLLLQAALSDDSYSFVNGQETGNTPESAPSVSLEGTAAFAGYDQSLTGNMAYGANLSIVGMMQMTAATEVEFAGTGNTNNASANASGSFTDFLVPSASVAIDFDPVFVGSASSLDATATGTFELTDITAAPGSVLVQQDAILNGAAPQAETLDLIAGHTYEIDVSAQIAASGYSGGGFDQNGGGALNTVSVQIQELNGSGAVVSGNPDLSFASGFDYETVPCFAAGTRIRTPRGEVPVETLRPSDSVVRAGGGTAAVVWIGERRVDCRRHPRPADVCPVRVRAGTFGPGRPARDLRLSPDHAVLTDGALVPIRCLIDGHAIVREVAGRVTYYHVELARHDVLLAENLPCESFLDTGNRAAFANGGAVVRLHADFARQLWDGDACAELVLGGPRLDAIRRRLRARVGARSMRLQRPR